MDGLDLISMLSKALLVARESKSTTVVYRPGNSETASRDIPLDWTLLSHLPKDGRIVAECYPTGAVYLHEDSA